MGVDPREKVYLSKKRELTNQLEGLTVEMLADVAKSWRQGEDVRSLSPHSSHAASWLPRHCFKAPLTTNV